MCQGATSNVGKHKQHCGRVRWSVWLGATSNVGKHHCRRVKWGMCLGATSNVGKQHCGRIR